MDKQKQERDPKTEPQSPPDPEPKAASPEGAAPVSASVDLTDEEREALAIPKGQRLSVDQCRLRKSARFKIAKAEGRFRSSGARKPMQPADARGAAMDPNLNPARVANASAGLQAPRA